LHTFVFFLQIKKYNELLWATTTLKEKVLQ
jgi:hypothetical protein